MDGALSRSVMSATSGATVAPATPLRTAALIPKTLTFPLRCSCRVHARLRFRVARPLRIPKHPHPGCTVAIARALLDIADPEAQLATSPSAFPAKGLRDSHDGSRGAVYRVAGGLCFPLSRFLELARSPECPVRAQSRWPSPQATFLPYLPKVPKTLTLTTKPLPTRRCAQEKPGVESVSYPGSKNIDSWSRIRDSTIRSFTQPLDGIRHERIDGKTTLYRRRF